ncbi:hypothetical protein D3C78_1225860 [compost metagenome]
MFGDRFLVQRAVLEIGGRIIVVDQMVRCRVPDIGIDAVDDAVQHMGAAADDAVQAHAELRGEDLLGIGRADGAERRCRLQAALQEAHIIIIFDAFHAEGMRWQRQLAEDIGAELALKGDVVDGEKARNLRRFGITHIDRRHGGLPVMGMHDIRPPAGKRAGGNTGCRERQCREALPIVWIVLAGLVEIGAAGALVIGGRIENEEIEPLMPYFEHISFFAEQIGKFQTFDGVRHGGFHRRISGYQCPRPDAKGF